jgi:hypothetical protein
VHRARSWTELLAQLFDGSWNPALRLHRSPFAFHGLTNVDHDLTTALQRLAGAHANIENLELAMLRNFRKYAHDQAPGAPDSIWQWLAVAQHHGLPTRLVDWTYSPLVALHFVTDTPSDMDRDGAVWCVNFIQAKAQLPKRLRQILDDEASDAFTVDMLGDVETLREFDALGRDPFLLFLEPPALDARIVNQAALFSVMPSPSASLDSWLAAHPQLCRRVVVPAELKWEVRDILDQSNINERTLFPGLDGLSRALARYYQPRVRD